MAEVSREWRNAATGPIRDSETNPDAYSIAHGQILDPVPQWRRRFVASLAGWLGVPIIIEPSRSNRVCRPKGYRATSV